MKVEREIHKIVAEEGLVVLSIEHRRKHYKAKVRSPEGHEGVIVMGVSPSDHRVENNVRAELRRIRRGVHKLWGRGL